MSPRFRTLLLTSTALLATSPGLAGPDGPAVVGGSATVTGAGTSTVRIDQTSSRAIIDWRTFNIRSGETTTFVQPGSSSVVLNRVTGGLGPSDISGTLNANGRVFLINRDGVLVSSTGVINTAGFLATTHDIKNEDFMAGRYNFNIPGRPDASIVNQGTITATSGGFAALVAPGVRNSGTITATLGTVALASGNSFTLDLYGDKLIQLSPSDQIAAKVIDVQTGKPLASLVTNEGKLSANGGRVELTAAQARAVVDSVINTKGVIEANSVGTRDGKIVLGAATAATKSAGVPKQTVKISGTISASGKDKGTKGGTVVVTGENIEVTNAKIDASGDAGGGKVMLGGDWAGGNPTYSVDSPSARLEGYTIATATTLSVDKATTIDASAKSSGNGGKVVLWSDSQTTFAGTIFARGAEAVASTQNGTVAGGSDGGFVEVSSKGQLVFTGQVDTRAPNGRNGTLLLDPANITISLDPDTGGFAPTTNNSVINVVTLQSALANNNVIVTTSAGGTQDGNITVAAPIVWSQATTLTLHADNNIAINADITAVAGGLTLQAGSAISATGAVSVGTFTLAGGDWTQVSANLPAFNAVDFRISSGTFLRATGGNGDSTTPYQIADVYGLQGIGSSSSTRSLLGRNYELAGNIDASGTAGWNGGAGFVPIGSIARSFSGSFDGLNHVVNGLTIKSASETVGLFGVNGGSIRNLGVTNATIIATGTEQFVGAVAGINFVLSDAGPNAGTISNTYATGSVGNAVDATSNLAIGGYGGLVGWNAVQGLITRSYSSVTVQVTGLGTGDLMVGGLVGKNKGTITESYANGPVNGTYSTYYMYLGGLVGWNLGGNIERSYATGSVTGTGNFGQLGGLVAVNSDGGSITQTFASGAITMSGAQSIAGGLVAANTATVTSSFWDKGTTGLTTSAAGTGLSTADARNKAVFQAAGWNFGDGGTWFMVDGATRPFLLSEYSTTINNGHQLQLIELNKSASYTLGSSFNIGSELNNPSGMWASKGFVPIGATGSPFTGQLDGKGNTIAGLKIAPNDSTTQSVGLFSVIGAAGVVKNLNLTDASVSANPGYYNQWLGVLAGQSAGTIDNVTATGTVNGGSTPGVIAGGLVGQQGIMGQTNLAGSITNSHAKVNVTVGNGDCSEGCIFNAAGGLVGANVAGSTITGSYAEGNVTTGATSWAGGLVGINGFFGSSPGNITNSYATGNVQATGTFAMAGGLAGYNSDGSTITDSKAFGTVTAGFNANNLTDFTQAGGLVGANAGLITSTTQPVQSSSCTTTAAFSCASGNVSVGTGGSAGGLVGSNLGTIDMAFASGMVTGASGLGNDDGKTHLGGLAGSNVGTVRNSHATGDVGNNNTIYVVAGGLVGDNGGLITNSFAIGNVTTGNNSLAGGLVGTNSAFDSGGNTIGGNNSATISNSFATGTVIVGNTSVAGGLVAVNDGIIAGATASGNVTGGTNSILGGLVGAFGVDGSGSISGSIASGNVTGQGSNSIVGGFVGLNAGTLDGTSSSTGAVSGQSQSYIGGFVGFNIGRIDGVNSTATAAVQGFGDANAVGGLVGGNAGTIVSSSAMRNVSGETNASVGGLVGTNLTLTNVATGLIPGSTFPVGTIADSSASGNVSGGTMSLVGGLVGSNGGTITSSTASGSADGGLSAMVGGLVGSNTGTFNAPVLPAILSSGCDVNMCSVLAFAVPSPDPGSITGSSSTGAVSGTSAAYIGGLVGFNPGTISGSQHTGGTVSGTTTLGVGGLVGLNTGTVTQSSATSPVFGSSGFIGGLVGVNAGQIDHSHATGSVETNGGYAGGFAGSNLGSIALSYATGNVKGTGPSYLGGFVSLNAGSINQTYARGSVTGVDGSHLGGFVAVNYRGGEAAAPGSITQSYAFGPVTGGNAVVAAGFAALNLGKLDQTYAVGLVKAGPGSTIGGLVASNNLPFSFQGAQTSPAPGTATNSYWDRQTTGQETSAGGTAMDTSVLAGGLPPGFDPTIWAHGSYPKLVNLGPQDTNPGPPVLPPLVTPDPPPPPPPPVTPDPPPVTPDPGPTVTPTPAPVPTVVNPPSQLLVVAATPTPTLTPPGDVVNLQSLTAQQQQQQTRQAADRTTTGSVPINNPVQLDVGANRFFFLPPAEETRLVINEVVIQLPCDAPQQALGAALSDLQLTVVSSQCLSINNMALYQLRTGDGKKIADVIRGLANYQIVAAAQANYVYALGQDPASIPPQAQEGDAGQYILDKLRLPDIHRRLRASNVPIAVIDSEIDSNHPDLAGAVVNKYDATGVEEKPHPHGTGMAGAIASHRRLVGTAPGARIFAIRAFSTKASNAESTTYNILKGLDYAVNNNVRIVNMSFAGPRDPSLERALKTAYDKGIVLIAAAGNAGPKSPPLFPAADKHVIAVTATDIDDKLFTGATRGAHIAVSAPGVDILVPAPQSAYQMTTGTSVATAHVSGIVALMLERNPRLTPADVKRILMQSAKKLGPNDQFGSGLIDPAKALQLSTPRTSEVTPAPATTATAAVQR